MKFHFPTFTVRSNVPGTDSQNSTTLEQLEYTSLDILFSPLIVEDVFTMYSLLCFFFGSYNDVEKEEQKKFKNKIHNLDECAKPPEESKVEFSSLFERWKKSSPFNFNITLPKTALVFASDPLDFFVEFSLLDISNRY